MFASGGFIRMKRGVLLAGCRLRTLAAMLALAVTTSAGAQIFRWVDEDGITHYASTPPADIKAARNLKRLADKAPASATRRRPEMAEAVARPAQPDGQELAGKIAELERQLAAERLARQAADAQARLPAPSQPVAQQAVIPYISSLPVIIVAPGRPHDGFPRHHGGGRQPLVTQRHAADMRHPSRDVSNPPAPGRWGVR